MTEAQRGIFSEGAVHHLYLELSVAESATPDATKRALGNILAAREVTGPEIVIAFGSALKVWRRSSPYGTVAEHGLYYVAFACDIHRFDVQLRRMYDLVGDGLHDRLIEYSEAVTGAYWYAPGAAELRGLVGG